MIQSSIRRCDKKSACCQGGADIEFPDLIGFVRLNGFRVEELHRYSGLPEQYTNIGQFLDNREIRRNQ